MNAADLYQWQQEKEYHLSQIQLLDTAIQQDLAAEKRCVSRYFPVPSPKDSAAQQQRPPKHFRREKITNTIWVIEEGNDGFVLVYLTRKPSTIECATNLIYGVGQFETDDKPSIVIKYDARSPEDRQIAIHEAKRQQISGALHEFNESALTGIASAPENALRHQFPTFDAVANAVEAVEEVRNIPQSTQDSGSCSQYGWQATLVVLVVVAGVVQGKKGGAPKSGLGSATRLTPEELVTGQRLESQLGKTLRESPHIGAEYVDDLGRSYDALGTPNASKFWNQKEFLASIDGHLLKSNDFTVIDLTGFTPAQIAAVNSHLATLTPAQLSRIIRIGF